MFARARMCVCVCACGGVNLCVTARSYFTVAAASELGTAIAGEVMRYFRFDKKICSLRIQLWVKKHHSNQDTHLSPKK